MTKAWVPIEPDAVAKFPGHVLPGHMGVFELADEAKQVLYIGCAGARSLFGLRGELETEFRSVRAARFYRYEVTTAYLTRHLELLMAHVADYGAPPPVNAERGVPPLGRLSP